MTGTGKHAKVKTRSPRPIPEGPFQKGRIFQEAEEPKSYWIEDNDGNVYRRNRSFISSKPLPTNQADQR